MQETEPTPPSPSSREWHRQFAGLLPEERPATSTPSQPFARGEVIDRFLLMDRLGAGGMGVVYAAYDPDLDRKVALKLLSPGKGGANTAEQTRLQREAQALAKLSHPNVVAVHDVGVDDARVWIAMEYVDGQTLGAWAGERPRRWSELVRVLVDVARGVAAAHAANLVHRDLKPKSECPPQTLPLPPSGRILADRGDLRGRCAASCRVMPQFWQPAGNKSERR